MREGGCLPQVKMSSSDAELFLCDQTAGHLATCDASGQPYVTPLNYIYYQGRIYFHCAHEGRKLDNLAANDRVCFEVSRVDKMVFGQESCGCSTRYTSVLVFGRARIVEDIERKKQVLDAMVEKFAFGRAFSPITLRAAGKCAVVEIAVESIHGKKNVDPQK